MRGDADETQCRERGDFFDQRVELVRIDPGAIEAGVEHDLDIRSLVARLSDPGEIIGGGGRAKRKHPTMPNGGLETRPLGADVRIFDGPQHDNRQICGEQRGGFINVRDGQTIHHRWLRVAVGKIAERIDNDVGVVAVCVGFHNRADFGFGADGLADQVDVVKDRRAGDEATGFAEGVFRVHANEPKDATRIRPGSHSITPILTGSDIGERNHRPLARLVQDSEEAEQFSLSAG